MIVWINTGRLNGENSDPLEQMMLELMEAEIKFKMNFFLRGRESRREEKANGAF